MVLKLLSILLSVSLENLLPWGMGEMSFSSGS